MTKQVGMRELISLAFHVLASLPLAIWLLLTRYPRTSRRLDNVAYIELERSPNQITTSDIISLIVLALCKYIPGYSPRLRADPASQTFILPQTRAEGILRISSQDVRAFQRSVLPGVDLPCTSSTNPFFLVAQTVPLIIYFLVNRACPIKPFGSVNTRNVIHIIQPSICRDAALLQQMSAQGRLTYISSSGGVESPGFRRKRGVESCTTIEIYLDNELLMQQQCWFLQFLPSSFEPRYQASKEEKSTTDRPSRQDSVKAEYGLQMTLNDALRWAASSKDYDGIHVSPLVARLFGFQGVLAHGNHVAALAIQQVQPSSDAPPASNGAGTLLWESDSPMTVDIKFIRPMILPAILAAQWHTADGDASKAQLTVLRHGKVCMAGECFVNK